MVKKRALLALLVATTLAGSASSASATKPTVSDSNGTNALVSDSIGRFGSPLTRLSVLQGRLIMALHISNGVVSVVLDPAGLGNDYRLDGMQDGTDGVDPLGVKDQALPREGPVPVTSNTHRP